VVPVPLPLVLDGGARSARPLLNLVALNGLEQPLYFRSYGLPGPEQA
jgi:hypothetical protein